MLKILSGFCVGLAVTLTGWAVWRSASRAADAQPGTPVHRSTMQFVSQEQPSPIDRGMVRTMPDVDPGMVRTMPDVDPGMLRNPDDRPPPPASEPSSL